MEQVIRDETGYPIFNRCQCVIENASDKLAQLGRTKGSSYAVKCILYKAVNDFELVDNGIAMNMSAQTLKEVFDDFLDLVAWVNKDYVFVPTKQFFASFAGISPTAYDNLLVHGNSEQRDVMTRIDTAIVDLSLDASAYGYAKENTTQFRMKAKGTAGHSIVTATPVDSLLSKAEETMSAKDYMLQLDNITASMLTENSKK